MGKNAIWFISFPCLYYIFMCMYLLIIKINERKKLSSPTLSFHQTCFSTWYRSNITRVWYFLLFLLHLKIYLPLLAELLVNDDSWSGFAVFARDLYGGSCGSPTVGSIKFNCRSSDWLFNSPQFGLYFSSTSSKHREQLLHDWTVFGLGLRIW